MNERWVVALVILAVGIVIAVLVSWLVRRRLARGAGGEATSAISTAAGWFSFWLVAFAAVLLALAMVRPETLEDVPRQILDYTPRILAAGLILLAGYALSIAASRIVGLGLKRASARSLLRATRTVRWVIMASASILALAQLGVDTTILLVLVAVGGLSIGLASALLVGFGGRQVAGEIAAGRYVGRFIDVGTIVDIADGQHEIVALHPATLEVKDSDGSSRHIPYSRLLEAGFTSRSPS